MRLLLLNHISPNQHVLMGDLQFSPYACVLCCNFHTLLRFCWRRGVFIFHLKTRVHANLDTPAQVLL